MQARLATLRDLLSAETCPELILKSFDEQELGHVGERLDRLYREYLEYREKMELILTEYRHYHDKMHTSIRVKNRALNEKLENNIPERQQLGLPPVSPIRSKVTLNPTNLSRSRHYHGRKKTG